MNIRKNGVNLLMVAEAVLLIAVLVLGLLGGAADALRDNNDNPIISDADNDDWYNKDGEGNKNPSGSGSGDKEPSGDKDPSGENPGGNDDPDTGKWYVPEDYTEGRVTFSDSVEAKLASMTKEQKIAQLFIITPEVLTGYKTVNAFGNASKQAYDKYPVGGLVYNTKNFQNTAQVQLLLAGIKNYGIQQYGITVFTAIEEEGGANYSPLATTLGLNRISLASELANQGLTAVQKAAKDRAEYLKKHEFNLLLTTVAEVATSLDTAYALRTYGTNAELVAQLVAADITASKEAGRMAALKYFPGKADAVDGGLGVLSSDATLEDLSKGSFLSYQAGIDAGATVVMVGNVIVESITDDENVPCSLSSRTIGLLRESMGFEGIIMTENFSDAAFNAIYGEDSACVEAIKAGVDMIYMPADFVKAYNAVLEAVNNGNISEDRLNNAVGRILTAKGV